MRKSTEAKIESTEAKVMEEVLERQEREAERS